MYNRLIDFIHKNQILSKHQYGFRKNKSTELAISQLVDKITKGVDRGKYTLGIFLDFSKAFDTINHRILIKKLEHYGMNRGGVPQGSILGPLFFILFADEILYNIFYSHSCPEKLNEIVPEELNKIMVWFDTNILSINNTKTKFILFRSRKKKNLINNEFIKQVKNITFLGVSIDECLTWKDHTWKYKFQTCRLRNTTIKTCRALSTKKCDI